MNAIKVNRRRVLTIAAALICVGALMYCVPLSLDDWAWGGKIGIERFLKGITEDTLAIF